jgi:hypothetical protein
MLLPGYTRISSIFDCSSFSPGLVASLERLFLRSKLGFYKVWYGILQNFLALRLVGIVEKNVVC